MKRSNRTILVTGATGNVGNEIVRQLSAIATKDSNVKVKAGVRSIKNGDKLEEKTELVEIDYTKPESLSKALEGIDDLFLLTPFQSDMVELSSNLVSEATKAGTIGHILKLSVMGADSDPGITPSRLHRQAEKIIEQSGIPFTFLRPNFFMQNFVNFFSNSIKSEGAFYLPAGDGKASFVDIRDIASVAVKILTDNQNGKYDGKAYNITGSEALTYRDTAEILSKEVSKRISYVNISEDDARKGLKEMGMDNWFIDSMMELFTISRAGYLSSISPAVQELTGKKPITFSQFAKDYAGSFK
jgi:uncharacterized protein YbjT (DUF2867 family)